MTMIDIARDGDEFSILCQGHAGYADPGNDIVCAAISILLQTLVVFMENEEFDFKYKLSSGYAWIYGKDCTEAFMLVKTGLELIESNYPQFVSITKGCTIFIDTDCD